MHTYLLLPPKHLQWLHVGISSLYTVTLHGVGICDWYRLVQSRGCFIGLIKIMFSTSCGTSQTEWHMTSKYHESDLLRFLMSYAKQSAQHTGFFNLPWDLFGQHDSMRDSLKACVSCQMHERWQPWSEAQPYKHKLDIQIDQNSPYYCWYLLLRGTLA